MFRLSIVTVVYNAAEALATTIETVRAQTYPAIEFIVVDGASKDGTVDVVHRNAARIDKWLSEPDRGIYDAMNKGLALASGDFVMFVNAGDVFVAPDVIAQMMSHVTDANTLYYGKVRLMDCTGRLSWEVPIIRRGSSEPPSSYLPHHQSIFYPRSYYSANQYDLSMGYRADVHFTEAAYKQLPRVFTKVTTILTTLGGASSRALMSIADLRKEMDKETAYARHVAAATGKNTALVDIAGTLFVRYLACKAGGLPLVHRLMYLKHKLKSRL